MFNNIGAVMPLIQTGKLRALGVTTLKRASALPDVPPIAEEGLTGVRRVGLVHLHRAGQDAAADHPQFHADTVKVLADSAVKSRLEQLGVVIVGSSPEELGAHLSARWTSGA